MTYSGGNTIVKETNQPVQQPNDTLATAQPVPMNHTIAGEIKVTRELDHDYYQVTAKEGQRISVELDSVRVSDKAYAESEYDLQLRILDAKGRELEKFKVPYGAWILAAPGQTVKKGAKLVSSPSVTTHCRF